MAIGIGFVLGVAVLREQIQQDLVAGCVVGDVALGQELAVVVDQGDVVRLLGPVDAAVDQLSLLYVPVFALVRAHAGPRSDLIPGLDQGPGRHLTSRSWHQLTARVPVCSQSSDGSGYQEITVRRARTTNSNE